MAAAQKGHLDVAKQLIKAGADVRLRAEDGIDALWYAAENGQLEIIMEILKINADIVDRKTINQYTPFHVAARMGYVEVCEYLHDNYAININNTDDYGRTPLMDAAMHNHPKIVEFLLAQNVNIHHKDGYMDGHRDLFFIDAFSFQPGAMIT